MGVSNEMKMIMTECQSGNHIVTSLVTKMAKLYKQTNHKEFETSFLFCIKKFLIIYKQLPQVERGLDFISKFVASLKVDKKPVPKRRKPDSDEEVEEEEEEEEMHPFQLKIFKFLIKHHGSQSKAVRFRCCQLINLLLADLGDGAQIDESLFDDIYETMHARAFDLSHLVRVQAALGMRRLQEPEKPTCVVTDVYLRLMSLDLNHSVRSAVLSSIAVTHKTLKAIIKRTGDINEAVRKQAYKIIAEKVHIKAMPISSRVALVKRGLNDASEPVREHCLNVLIKGWLDLLDNDLLKLLDCLDCQNYLPVCEKLLMELLKRRKAEDIIEDFNLLDERHCIPFEKLNKENALFWRCLCQHFQSLGSTQEENLEKLLPTCLPFVDYLKSIMSQKKADEDVYEALQSSFILQQIFMIMGYLDVSDEAGRRAVIGVIRELLLDEKTSEDMYKHLMEQLLRLIRDDVSCMEKVSSIISDILQPVMSDENIEVETEKRKKMEIELTKFNVEILHLKDILEDSITKQDFNRAAEVKTNLEELERQKDHIEKEMEGRDSQEEPGSSQVARSQTKDDPATLLRCLLIVQEVLMGVRFNKLNSSMLSFISILIIPGITSSSPIVRNIALKCLGLSCLRDPRKIGQYFVIFMEASVVDTEEIRVTAFQMMFNFFHFFGFGVVSKVIDSTDQANKEGVVNGDGDDDNDAAPIPVEGDEDFGTKILNHMTKNLDSESPSIRTVCAEGLAKLLLSSRVSSPSLLTRLVLLWYNPMTEEDTRLRQCLGAFFPFYAYSSRANQEMIGEAFLTTLKTLLEAPGTSPLSKIKVMSVAELLVHLSNIKHQKAKTGMIEKALLDKCPHDDVAVALCNEILTDPNNVDNVKVYTKTLMMLDLSLTNDCLFKSLQILGDKIEKEVKDRSNKQSLLRFFYKMFSLSKEVTKENSQLDNTVVVADDDEEDKDRNPEEENISVPPSTASSSNVALETTSTTSTKKSSKAKKTGTGLQKMTELKISLEDAENLNSSDDFEAAPKTSRPTRKAKTQSIMKNQLLVKNRKRNLVIPDSDDDDDDDQNELVVSNVSKKQRIEDDDDDDEEVENDNETDDGADDDIDDASMDAFSDDSD